MATIDVYNMKREKVGSVELADEVFATEVKEHLFYEVVKAQLASRRQGTAAAKNRSAVSGSTKKLYKQKGTGRARHGSIRAPVYVGGGRAHPPRPRDWGYRPPQQVRASALRSALSKLHAEERPRRGQRGEREAPHVDPQLQGSPVPAAGRGQRVRPPPSRHPGAQQGR